MEDHISENGREADAAGTHAADRENDIDVLLALELIHVDEPEGISKLAHKLSQPDCCQPRICLGSQRVEGPSPTLNGW